MRKDKKSELEKEGEEFLKKLRAAPYNNDMVGQSFIRKVSKREEPKKVIIKPGSKLYELINDIELKNALKGKTFISKVSKKK